MIAGQILTPWAYKSRVGGAKQDTLHTPLQPCSATLAVAAARENPIFPSSGNDVLLARSHVHGDVGARISRMGPASYGGKPFLEGGN